jgi:hypothetical protein
MNRAAAARSTPVQKIAPMQSSPRKVSAKVLSAIQSPEKKLKSPARRPKPRPESTSTAKPSTHASVEAQVQATQQHQVEDFDPFNTASAQTAPTLSNLTRPDFTERSHSEGHQLGIQWKILIDCPGGHAAPLKIITGSSSN